ncbi:MULTISPECIES: chromate resistance protein ChrB domain-containing protein [Bacillaceae]|uniref:Chromate resistance protein ChrB domain-containing protein n=1 Tax=Metabacillus herbersteinensis TaxID=283816 RepID=A0ABV6GJQ1_9BACI|nr:chromate resistance protein ChrB domain-containing protein [Cytobacillus oceanisediminis]
MIRSIHACGGDLTNAAGLDAICQGLRMTSDKDHEALEKGYMIYEALYVQLAVEDLPAPGRSCV